MRAEFRAVAASVTDYWSLGSSIKDQCSELASVYAVEALASFALGRREADSAFWQNFDRSLETGQCTFWLCAESARNYVEGVSEGFVDANEDGDPCWVDRVVQMTRTGVEAAVASDATFRVFDLNMEPHSSCLQGICQRKSLHL